MTSTYDDDHIHEISDVVQSSHELAEHLVFFSEDYESGERLDFNLHPKKFDQPKRTHSSNEKIFHNSSSMLSCVSNCFSMIKNSFMLFYNRF